MEDFNSVVFGRAPQINPLKVEEKKKIRKISNLIGAAFIAMPGHKGLYGPQGTGVLLCGEVPVRPLLYPWSQLPWS